MRGQRGLLHGLGFADALAEVGLPENSIPLALPFFNIDVEVGQVLFIVADILSARPMMH
ncbi:MAG: HupE/UreJ family protein [Arenimonas sp.]|nr:HupE/UreJ family protein [Arenimonas sp.]